MKVSKVVSLIFFLQVKEYDGDNSFISLKDFALKFLDNSLTLKEVWPRLKYDEAVVSLTSLNFNNVIRNYFTFVMFYAPWCGQCEILLPVFKELGNDFRGERTVTFAKLDCTVNVNANFCFQQKVSFIPLQFIPEF